MKLFLSWSGPRSKAVADALASWLPHAIHAVQPWMSSEPDEGMPWNGVISKQLESTSLGIICLTADNATSPRILFEAGALAKSNAWVGTLLLDVERETVGPQLRHFHHTVFEKDDMRRLLGAINGRVIASGELGLTELMLNHSFEAWWPRLRQKLESIPPVSSASVSDWEEDEPLTATGDRISA